MNQQIIDNNKLIAEFMEAKPNLYTLRKDGSRNYFYGIHVGNIYEKAIKPKGMPFYTDWNWLMPVVEKIGLLKNRIIIHKDFKLIYCEIICRVKRKISKEVLEFGETAIEATYNGVTEFIKWYNKEVKQ